MKIEEEIDQGSIIALSPKCYSIRGISFEVSDHGTLNEVTKKKRGMKGIHQDTCISHESFLKCLYHDKPVLRDQFAFRIKANSKEIDLIRNEKIALNSIYYKSFVERDLVTCTPLKLNDKFV